MPKRHLATDGQPAVVFTKAGPSLGCSYGLTAPPPALHESSSSWETL